MSEDSHDRRREIAERVTYVLLRGAARVAGGLDVPLARLGRLVEMAYFHELRASGLTLEQVGKRLGVSVRKAAQLSRLLKENFLPAGETHSLSRRIQFMLWPAPLGERRIRQLLPDTSEEDLDRALEHLCETGRIVRIPGRTPRFAVSRQPTRLVQDAWAPRLDALEHLVGSVTSAIRARFFEADETALARTVSLRMKAADLPKLRALYEDAIWPALCGLEAALDDDPDAPSLELDVSVVWARPGGGEAIQGTKGAEE